MYFGKPVIASRVGGIPEVIEDDESGLLVPPDDPETLAKCITALIQNSELRLSMGKKGQAIVQNKFIVSEIVNQNLKAYNKAKSDGLS